jgi:glycosyltransferase involved in cell wall biosynthesis
MQEALKLPHWVNYHGPTNPAELARKWLPSATGLITLSRHPEGRPQVIVEALASGIPVLASDLPAHREILDSSGGGLIVNNCMELNDLLNRLEGAEGLQRGGAGREWVRQSIGTWADCAAKYSSIYRELLCWNESGTYE